MLWLVRTASGGMLDVLGVTMVHLAGIPLTDILESFVRGENMLLSRRGKPFCALCTLIDSGQQADGPLEQTLASLPTLHTVIADDVLLVLPGRWDGDDGGAVWSTLSPQGMDAPSMVPSETPSAEVAKVVVQPGASAGGEPPGDRPPDYPRRTRAVVEFVAGGKGRARDVRTFSILGVNDLLDWLSVGPGVDPSVLFLCAAERRAVFVQIGETLGVTSLFTGMRDRLHETPGRPAQAVWEACQDAGLTDEEVLRPGAEAFSGWDAVCMRKLRPGPPRAGKILG
ncbi:hypothetical protein ACH9EU_00745 [Kocuria sp. M1R5S2]|uniref:hypothetical protein n=1 Tax=Kocuria rhizosphaerae TaxID=3376285 RepID=UPI003791FAF4